jgi:hypothetical protein
MLLVRYLIRGIAQRKWVLSPMPNAPNLAAVAVAEPFDETEAKAAVR